MNAKGSEIVDRIKSLSEIKCLAVDLGIKPQVISNWKMRDTIPAADVLLKIAKYLNVSVEWLITGEDSDGMTPEIRTLISKYEILDERDRAVVIQMIDGLGARYLGSATVEPEQSNERIG